MNKNDEETSIFFDKRDESYTEVKAYHNFFELFLNNHKKCTGINIPETVLFRDGLNKIFSNNLKMSHYRKCQSLDL